MIWSLVVEPAGSMEDQPVSEKEAQTASAHHHKVQILEGHLKCILLMLQNSFMPRKLQTSVSAPHLFVKRTL